MKPAKNKNIDDVKNWIDLLPSAVGKLWMVNGETERILHYEFEDGKLILKTDKRQRKVTMVEVSDLLSKFLPIDESIQPFQGNEMERYQPAFNSNTFGILRDKLLKNIEKVEENKDYIPQAEEVRNGVESVIKLARTEIDFVKTLHNIQ